MENDIDIMRRRAGLAKDGMSPKSELKRALDNIRTACDEVKYALQRHQDPSGWISGIEKELVKAIGCSNVLLNPAGQD